MAECGRIRRVRVTCPAPRRHTAKMTESDRESIATLAGPNIYILLQCGRI
jgi:hypothetical protein